MSKNSNPLGIIQYKIIFKIYNKLLRKKSELKIDYYEDKEHFCNERKLNT